MAEELCNTFPEFKHKIEYWANLPTDADEWTSTVIPHCIREFPPMFFEIVFRSDGLFDPVTETKDLKQPLHVLPGIDFRELYHAEQVGEDIQESIWDYMHAILFEIIPLVQDKTQFGDAAQLFESMPDGEIQERIQRAFENNPFLQKEHGANEAAAEHAAEAAETKDNDAAETKDNDAAETKDKDAAEDRAGKFKQTLEKLMGSKLGQLSQTLLDELKPELKEMFPDIDMETQGSEALKRLIKTPTKMLKLVYMAKQKMEAKINRGEINKEELMEDMAEIMKDKHLKKEMEDMMKNMGGAGGFNHPAVKTELAKNAQKNRMRQKLDLQKQNAFFNTDDDATPTPTDADRARQKAEENIANITCAPRMTDAEIEAIFAENKANTRPPKHKKNKKK